MEKFLTSIVMLWFAGGAITHFFGPEPDCNNHIVLKKVAAEIVKGSSVPASDIKFSPKEGFYCTMQFKPSGSSDGLINYETAYGWRIRGIIPSDVIWILKWFEYNPHPHTFSIKTNGRWIKGVY